MTAETDPLHKQCELAAKLWSRTFSGLTAMTYRERGDEAISQLWYLLLTTHQGGHYREGLRKLGIRDDEPPAVAAAKYHYFTNLLGGLPMEYVEESPRKVWVRYLAPMWTYAGVTMLALPGKLRRRIMSSWHPRNGELMGCPRLGWVGTKFVMEGSPYDEGYFCEYDRDLSPDERMGWETPKHTPECDYSKLPDLDPVMWPDARRWKARRNFSAGYVSTPVQILYRLYGEYVTHYLVGETLRCLAVQYTHEFLRDLDIKGRDLDSIVALFSGLLSACGQNFEVSSDGDRRRRIVLHGFKPFEDDALEGLRAACFQFQEMATRLMNGHVAVTRRRIDETTEEWQLHDTGNWLW
jgi:hypothetical protein